MHDHGAAAGDSGIIQGLLVVAVLVTAAVHLGGRYVESGRRVDGYLVGHALMAAGMVWMLVPGSPASGPPGALAPVFGIGGAWFALLVVRSCRRSLWKGALRYGDLVVGYGAMAYMLVPARLRLSPLTAALVGYFLLLGLIAAAVILGRSVTLELPQEAFGGPAPPPTPGQVSRFSDSVSTRSAFAHASMAVGMVYMLARL